MSRSPRSDHFDPLEVSVFHCRNRCVRQSYLLGDDPLTGKNYDHRKQWIEDRIEFLAGQYAIDVIGFSVMSNHFHVVLRNRPDIVATWTDQEVARRWLMLCPIRKQADGTPETPTQSEIDALVNDTKKLQEVRIRLSHISWFMRMLDEHISRRANAEDGKTGHFWEGRFWGTKLIEVVAILACLMYVDLNPIRAGMARTPEESQHTSAQRRAQRRIDQDHGKPAQAADWLAPMTLDETASPGPMPSHLTCRCSDKGFLPLSLDQYLKLLDWTGRQVASGKNGKIPEHLAPILVRLGIDADAWMTVTTRFDELFYRIAGRRETLAREAERKGRRWYQAPGSRLFTSTVA